MVRGPFVRGVLLSSAALSLVAACASPPSPSGPAGELGPQRPTAVGDDPQITVSPLAEPILLDGIPDPLRVTGVRYNEGGQFSEGVSTLYADPDRGDTLDGPVLIVGHGGGSACLPGPPEHAETEDVDLGEHEGRLARIGDFLFVGSYGNDVVSFVLARGVPEEEVIAAAATLDPSDSDPGLPPGFVPAGLAAVVTGPGGAGVFSDAGERLALTGGSGAGGPRVYVTAVRADPRLAALWGGWLDDREGTTIRGTAGSAGPVLVTYCGSPAVGRVWAEDGLVFAVEGEDGADAAMVDAVVAGLRPGTEAELAALQGSVIDAPVTGVDAGCWADSAVVSGVVDGVRWMYAVGTPPDFPDIGPQECTILLTADGGSGAGTGSLTLSPPGRLTVSGAAIGGGDASGQIVAGIAPAGSTRVTVTASSDGSTTEALLGPVVTTEIGPRPGDRLFGAFFPGEPDVNVGYEVIAYDADGAILDRVTS